jgi:hypothetical protein
MLNEKSQNKTTLRAVNKYHFHHEAKNYREREQNAKHKTTILSNSLVVP